MRRTQIVLGAAAALAAALAGSLIGARIAEHPQLGVLLIVLAPTLFLGNLAVLPSALLVRERDFRAVFLLDVAQVLALSIATLSLAACGFGALSLVGGWYANALAAWLVSTRLAARHMPALDSASATVETDWRATRSFGSHLVGAALFSYVVERLDSFAIGARLGRAALGVWELALHLSQAGLSYTTGLVDRLIVPPLSAEHRAQRLVPVLAEVLRFAFLVLLPLHVALSLCASPAVRATFPAGWQASAPLFSCLALAAGARSLEVVLVAALKAAGRGRSVLLLSWLRLFLLAAMLVLCLPHGLEAVALGVLWARAIAALVSLFAVVRFFGPELARNGVTLVAPIGLCASWSAALFAAARFAAPLERERPLVFVIVFLPAALASWVAMRWAFDKSSLVREFAWLRRGLLFGAPLAPEGRG